MNVLGYLLTPSVPTGDVTTKGVNAAFLNNNVLRCDVSQSLSSAYQAQAKANLGISAVTGTTVVDFGTAGALSTSVAVTGQANILATSAVNGWLVATATADHSVDEHLVEAIQIIAGNIVAGTGFTLYALSQTLPLYGKWTVSWSWN